MKNLLVAPMLLLATVAGFAQQAIIWEPEIPVADGSVYGTIRPRIALAENDVPLVLMSHANGQMHIARKTGASFDSPVSLLPGTMEGYVANWTGPDIAAHGNQVVVVLKAQTLEDGHIYALRSTDGGLTFSDTLRVDSHEAGRTFMPALDMDDDGNPVVTYMVFDAAETDSRIAVARSTDGGVTYLPQQIISDITPGVACDCCPPEMVVKGDYQLALFRNNNADFRDTWGILSEDAGLTYDSQDNLNDLNWNVDFCPSTGAHGIIIGDTAYVVSTSQASTAYRVYISTASLSGGLSLQDIQMVDPPLITSSDTQNFPRISGSSDTLVMVWEEKRQNNPDVLYAVTTDGSITTLASHKYLLNENTAGTQGKPDVVYKNGYVHVVYQDNISGDLIYRRGFISEEAGIEELSAEVVLFPNPSAGDVSIYGLPKGLNSGLKVHASDGKQVQVAFEAIGEHTVLHFSPLTPAGIYFLEWTDLSGQKRLHRIALQ